MSNIVLHIATALEDLTPVTITPEALFGRHCAVLGSSGGGKSWSLARIVEQASAHNAKILLFDASGEFERLTHSTFHVHIGAPSRDIANSASVTVPYFELSENDLVKVFEPSNAVQWMKLRAAIKTLRLMQLVPGLAASGNFSKAHRHKVIFEEAVSLHAKQLEKSQSIFNIFKLPLQIELECVEPIRSGSEPDFWGGVSASEQTQCIPMINRIEDLLKSPEMRCIFNPPAGPSAFEALDKFMTDKSVSVLRVSMEFLPSAHRIRHIVADSLCRYMLSMARAGTLRKTPVVIALDEAHQVLQESRPAEGGVLPLSAFDTIAKEGRKYGLTLCLATQRPGDIPESLLSQIGTFIVHRLVGPTDLKAVERAAGGVDLKTLTSLATIGPGEAFIIGAGIREPRRVKMLPPLHPPMSQGPNYQAAWKKDGVKTE